MYEAAHHHPNPIKGLVDLQCSLVMHCAPGAILASGLTPTQYSSLNPILPPPTPASDNNTIGLAGNIGSKSATCWRHVRMLLILGQHGHKIFVSRIADTVPHTRNICMHKDQTWITDTTPPVTTPTLLLYPAIATPILPLLLLFVCSSRGSQDGHGSSRRAAEQQCCLDAIALALAPPPLPSPLPLPLPLPSLLLLLSLSLLPMSSPLSWDGVMP